ncbi:hypothetical protein [Limnochorda pilosa]|uniref:hypothetical protein n=1 Tax=Limnochorda pilosa TaxID=1555112 RepID=UPI0011873E40|nr:hypothetical protein [Limnochorda pilosa]
MSDFRISWEWESPEAARGPELRATWARLEIVVDGQPVTQVEDRVAHSVRNAVYAPLYPVAEWIATNWWPMLYEVFSSTRVDAAVYARRHSLASAAEGFALPNLTFQPEGESLLLMWAPLSLDDRGVRFLARGAGRVERQRAEAELSRFVEAVVRRLEEQNVGQTLLSEEWEAIHSADSDERAFAQAAGRLGRDPYAITDQEGEAITRAVKALPAGLVDDFLAAVDHLDLLSESQAVVAFLEEASGSQVSLDPLRDLRHKLPPLPSDLPPWKQGYEFARRLRAELGAKEARIRSREDLARLFHLDRGQWDQAVLSRSNGFKFVEAAVAQTQTGSPYFFVRRPRPEAQVFALCRALFEYLTAPGAGGALVTPALSDRQKRNRAFSAEFIAPAELLRQAIRRLVVSDDDVQDLAADFGTSEFVIRHQIANHEIAELVVDR